MDKDREPLSTAELMMFKLLLLICVASSFGLGLQGDDCDLRPDLYRARRTLIDRYGREVGNDYTGHKAAADILLEDIRGVDRQYFRYMLAVARATRESSVTNLDRCCAASVADPIARHICALGRYARGRRSGTSLLLQDIPTDQESADALWALDEISHSNEGRGGQVTIPFGPYGPVQLYLDNIFDLVAEGDREATRRYLALFGFANGEHAEEMEDQLEALFAKRTRIVVLNWYIIRGYTQALSDLRDDMSAADRERASRLVQEECVRERQDCSELLRFLK